MARPLLSKAALVVVINPFAAPLDENGRPCTIVQFDPDHTPAGKIRRIGCSLDRKPVKDSRPRHRGVQASPSQYPRFDTTVIYDLGAKPVPHSVYHVTMVRDGALLPGDEATATRCGVKFVPPAEALAKALREAVAAWLVEHPGEAIDSERWLDAGQFAGWFVPQAPIDAGPAMGGEEAARARMEAAEALAHQSAEAAAKAIRDGIAAGAADAEKIMAQRKARAERATNKPTRAAPTALGGDA